MSARIAAQLSGRSKSKLNTAKISVTVTHELVCHYKQQANLIFSQRSTINAGSIKTALQPLLEDLVGFFIIEKQVLRICQDFRTSQEVDLLWDEMCERIARIVSEGLKACEDLDTFLAVKPVVLAFEQTLQVRSTDNVRDEFRKHNHAILVRDTASTLAL